MNREALFAAVLADPDDDAPRLVFADWLLEQGDPLGEFIQLQCALGRPLYGARAFPMNRDPTAKQPPSPEEVAAREKTLLRKHQKTWIAPIREFVRTWQWRRGFVSAVVADAAKFLAGAEKVFANAPVETIELTALKPPLVKALGETTTMGSLRALKLGQQRIGPKEVTFLHGANFTKLRSLDLWGNPLKDEGLAVFAAAQKLDGLRQLDLSTLGITAAGVDALSRAAFFPRIEKLSIRYNRGLGPTAGEMFARGKALVSLDLTLCNLGDEGIRAIAESPNMQNLEELNLAGNDIGPDGALALARSNKLPKLQRLSGLLGYGDEQLEAPAIKNALLERFGQHALR